MKYIIDVPEEIAKISEEFLLKAGLLCEPYTGPDRKAIEDEIKAGDEVEYECCGEIVKFIVTGVNGSIAYGFKSPCEYHDVGEYSHIDGLHKTGRHFPEVVELLKKMRGEEE